MLLYLYNLLSFVTTANALQSSTHEECARHAVLCAEQNMSGVLRAQQVAGAPSVQKQTF